jgi:hypothetical protein
VGEAGAAGVAGAGVGVCAAAATGSANAKIAADSRRVDVFIDGSSDQVLDG